jgi:hypothetical protein
MFLSPLQLTKKKFFNYNFNSNLPIRVVYLEVALNSGLFLCYAVQVMVRGHAVA